MLDLSACRLSPFDHQVVGVNALVKWDDPAVGRTIGGVFFLADDMGAGKTKQVIDAAQVLYVQQQIHRVVIVAPSAVRSVWFDPELGELRKHLWLNLPSRIFEFHSKLRRWDFGPEGENRMKWVITNYDFIRGRGVENEHLQKLLKACDSKTMLVLDESSAVKSYKALQTKTCLKIRAKCGRIVLLNGTPISHSPLDMYSQGAMLSPNILGCKTVFQFRARYAVMGGYMQKEIVDWVNLDDLQRRFAPYVLRRMKEQCLDLPQKLPSVALTVPLSEGSWKLYKQMRDDMVAWLSNTTVSIAPQAIVKTMRLAQLTSGFLGGIQTEVPEDDGAPVLQEIREVGHEKFDLIMAWLREQWERDEAFKVLIWCRFRAEIDRLAGALEKIQNISTGRIWGGQKAGERASAIRLLDPRTMPTRGVAVIGNPASGSMGLNLTGTHTVLYGSNDFVLKNRLQSEDRVYRSGQTNIVSYFDVVATGPQGQKTIDHTVINSLRARQDLASWTTSAWIAALKEE